MFTQVNHPEIRPVRWPFVRWVLAAALLASPLFAGAHEKAAGQSPTSASVPMGHSHMGHAGAHACMAMTGDVDYDFAVNMRKHHQMALMMSEAQLKQGKDGALGVMATQMIAAQKKEIAELDRWIETRDRAKASERAN